MLFMNSCLLLWSVSAYQWSVYKAKLQPDGKETDKPLNNHPIASYFYRAAGLCRITYIYIHIHMILHFRLGGVPLLL